MTKALKKNRVLSVPLTKPKKTTPKKPAKKKRVILQDHTKGSDWHKGTAKTLSDLKEKLKAANRSLGEGVHDIGAVLKQIRDKKLFRADNSDCFKTWIEDHTNFTRATAHNMILVAEHLTREKAGRFGPSLSYTLAKSTGMAAEKEIIKLAQTGVSPTQVEHERLRLLKEQTQSTLPPKKRARKPKAAAKAPDATKVKKTVKEGPTRIGQFGTESRTIEVEVPVKKGATGTGKIKSIKVSKAGKADIKAGWDKHVPKLEVGGVTIRLEINVKKGLVRYKVVK